MKALPTPREYTVEEQMEALAKLREPFRPEQIHQLPVGGGRNLDYVGHADITERLLDIDPFWNWEPAGWAGEGHPRFDYYGNPPVSTADRNNPPCGLLIKLTVCGMTRYGYGTVDPEKYKRIPADAIKELIGDAIRNAAMRFGCGLDLWKKDDGSGGAQQPSVPPGVQLPSTLLCEYCGAVHEDTGGFRTMRAKKDTKNIKAGDPIFKCPECNKWPPVKEAPEPAPVPDDDDLPF